MIDIIANFFKQSREESINKTPEGMCPNCWGTQECDEIIREFYDDK
ncbi:MAG: hypothetical protein MK105_07195 [Crocinitomicaceae bacterium]|nr:hypothetical protein [Crocinitomicaceae bacterium]